MEINNFLEIYWRYYHQLESDFFALEPFCAIDKVNDHAFSTKYLELIQTICGEVDTVCKRLCYCLDSTLDLNHCGINDYKSILMRKFPQIADEKVTINQHIYREVQPWQTWAHKKTPHWWSTYNKVKHHRDEVWNGKEAYKYANQKTVLEAICALYIILEYWAAYNFVLSNQEQNSYRMLQVKSKRLSIEGWNVFYSYFMGNEFFNADICRNYLAPNSNIEEEKDDGTV